MAQYPEYPVCFEPTRPTNCGDLGFQSLAQLTPLEPVEISSEVSVMKVILPNNVQEATYPFTPFF